MFDTKTSMQNRFFSFLFFLFQNRCKSVCGIIEIKVYCDYSKAVQCAQIKEIPVSGIVGCKQAKWPLDANSHR